METKPATQYAYLREAAFVCGTHRQQYEKQGDKWACPACGAAIDPAGDLHAHITGESVEWRQKLDNQTLALRKGD